MTQLQILQAARAGYQSNLAEIDRLIAKETGQTTPTSIVVNLTSEKSEKRRKTVSPAGRKRMAEAQRKRWAQRKAGASGPEAVPPKKRKMSAAGRKRIAAATKKRWAEFRAAKASAA